MQKTVNMRLFFVFLVSIPAIMGCANLQVKPAAPVAMPVSQSEPLPLKVGVIIEDQKVTGGFSDFGPRFSESLRNANVFQEVQYPITYSPESSGRMDLLVYAKFTGAFVADPSSSRKAFISVCLLYLPAPAITYDHKYVATGTISFRDKTGNAVKQISDQEEVVASVQIMTRPGDAERAGVKSATENLIYKLIKNVIDDRAAFAEIKK